VLSLVTLHIGGGEGSSGGGGCKQHLGGKKEEQVENPPANVQVRAGKKGKGQVNPPYEVGSVFIRWNARAETL